MTLVTSLAITQVWDLIETWGFRVDDLSDFPISSHKKFTKSNIMQPLKYGNFCSFLAITPVWDLIETWGFRVDDPYALFLRCLFSRKPVISEKTNNISQMVKATLTKLF